MECWWLPRLTSKASLPWFRLPEDNTLLPACLLLIFGVDYNGESRRDVNLARVSVVAMRLGSRSMPLPAFIKRLALGELITD